MSPAAVPKEKQAMPVWNDFCKLFLYNTFGPSILSYIPLIVLSFHNETETHYLNIVEAVQGLPQGLLQPSLRGVGELA